MSSDITTKVGEIERFVPLPISLLAENLTHPLNDSIAEFLKKPYAIRSGTFSTGDVYGTGSLGTNVQLPGDIILIPPYFAKLQGFMYFRATTVFTLVVNANPFVQGLYALCYVPQGGNDFNDPQWDTWFKIHSQSVTQRSQLPHVKINLSTETQATLKIPWVSSYSAYSIPSVGTVGMMGTVTMVPFSSYQTGTGGAGSCSFTLYVHLEDLDLSVPVAPHADTTIYKTTPEREEQSKKQIGPIESTLRVGEMITTRLSKVPLLSSVAAPAAWFCELAGDVASSFGWSKPRNADVQTQIVRDLMFGTNLIDSSDNSRSLALSDKNTVEVLPGFAGTDIDEMSFDSFLTKPTILNGQVWHVSDVSGTRIFLQQISPLFMSNTFTIFGSAPPATATNHSPVSWLSQYFQYWRGAFRLTFRIVKTNLHSGRLSFVYSPKQTSMSSDLDTDYVDSVYTWRHIVDIRTTDVVSLTIPFTSVSEYRPNVGLDNVQGSIQVFVVDNLSAPPSCAQQVDILYEVSAEPGFEFAVPTNNSSTMVRGIPVAAAPHSSTGVFAITEEISPIGSSDAISNVDHQPARLCIGEVVTNLRQMIRRSSPMTTSNPLNFTFVNTCNPYLTPIASFTGTTTAFLQTGGGDIYSNLAAIFAMQRGSVRIKFTTIAPQGFFQAIRLERVPESATLLGTFFLNTGGATGPLGAIPNAETSTAFIYVDQDARGGAEVSVPSYSRYHSRSNASALTWSGQAATFSNTTNPTVSIVVDVAGNTESVRILRSGGDDFNFGQFVSIPTTLNQ